MMLKLRVIHSFNWYRKGMIWFFRRVTYTFNLRKLSLVILWVLIINNKMICGILIQSWWQQHEAVPTSGLFGTSAPQHTLSDALSFESPQNRSLKTTQFPHHLITYLWVHWVAVWGVPKAPSVPGNRHPGETLPSAESEHFQCELSRDMLAKLDWHNLQLSLIGDISHTDLKKNHSVLFSLIQEPFLKQFVFPTAFPYLQTCTEVIARAMGTHPDSLDFQVEGCTLLLKILSQGTIIRLPPSAGSCKDLCSR